MGMLFNTKATNRMLEIVNAAFSSENWDFWFQPMADQTIPKDLFKETDTTWPLHKIAKKVGIFGPDGEGGSKDKRFVKWLKGLQKAGLSVELKRQINWAFDNENASEIYFVLIPSDQIGLGPFPPNLMGSTVVIMISTVEIDHIPAFLEQQRARLAARRKKKL